MYFSSANFVIGISIMHLIPTYSRGHGSQMHFNDGNMLVTMFTFSKVQSHVNRQTRSILEDRGMTFGISGALWTGPFTSVLAVTVIKGREQVSTQEETMGGLEDGLR